MTGFGGRFLGGSLVGNGKCLREVVRAVVGLPPDEVRGRDCEFGLGWLDCDLSSD